MMWFAFDSMGEFAFNQSFDMMKTGSWHKLIKQQHSALSLLGPLNPTPWAIRLGFTFASYIPPISHFAAMMDFCKGCIINRMKVYMFHALFLSFFLSQKQNLFPSLKSTYESFAYICPLLFQRKLPDKSDIAGWFIEEFDSGHAADTLKDRTNLLVGNAASVIVGGR